MTDMVLSPVNAADGACPSIDIRHDRRTIGEMDDAGRAQALDRAVHSHMTRGWVIESRTDLSVSLRKGKLNNPMWFIISLVTTPFVFGLGFVVWAIVAASNRSQRMVLWVDQNGIVKMGDGYIVGGQQT